MPSCIQRLVVVVCASIALLAIAGEAHAQNLRVVPVPWVATDVTIPHQAYNGHATTFKAIARGGDGTYLVEWDFNGDGVYDSATPTTNRYNLSARYTYPNQPTTTTFVAKIRVSSNGQAVTASYPVRVFADVPAAPASANDRQLQVMRNVAIDDSLWYLHTQMTRSGNEEDPNTGAQITGHTGGVAHAAAYLWALGLHGHYAAFPTAYIGTLPDPADNLQRYRDDPYAEDAARLVNYLVSQLAPVTVSTNAGNTQAAPNDESNAVGFYPEVQQEPIWGTDDGFGLFYGDNYHVGHMVSALSVARLGGYIAQVGDQNRVLGRRMEYVLQQLVDGLVWSQNDGGSYPGSWYYSPNANTDDMSTTLWGMTGLWHADRFAADQGVIVPNIAKARLISFVFQGSRICNGGTGHSYRVSTCDFTLSAGQLLPLAWMGANTFASNDPRLAFPGYSLNANPTLGQLRQLYDGSTAFITNTFNQSWAGYQSWNTGFVVGGDYNRVDGQGCIYCMLHWQDAARAAVPAVVNFGNNNWSRLFSTFLIRNQAVDGSVGWTYSLGANSDSSGGPNLRAAWALLVLSPDEIPPLAIGTSSQTTAPEGTAIAFDGSASDPGSGNPQYTWSFGNGATATGQSVSYAYPDNGMFNATLSSVTTADTSVDTVQVTITNVAPVASAGPDLSVAEGTSLPFSVTATDPGAGDILTYTWNFADGSFANAQTPVHAFGDDGSFAVLAMVTDDDGGSGTDTVVVTVSNVAPVITSTPLTTANEGAAYTYTLAFSDAGTGDTHACSAPTLPAGMTRTDCTLEWTPTFAQANASSAVEVCVTDDDGGTACQPFAIAVTFVDTDADDLPDAWEIDHFGDLAQTSAGDPDGDGRDNAEEVADATDPTVYDGPTAPVAQAPSCGSTITTLQATLVATNALEGDGLRYQFELYGDVGLGVLIASADDIPEGTDTTEWTVSQNLIENTRYYWRVRARDTTSFYGPYATVCDFFVDTVNEVPGAPRLNTPAPGSHVGSLTPSLVVDNAIDPDQDALTYTYEVYADLGLTTLVASETGVASGASTTSWTVDVALAEDTPYWWRARATDPGDLASAWSAVGELFVTTVNAAPEPPVIVGPADGDVMPDLRPPLHILNGDDADLDVLVYDWQLATDEAFATVIDSGDDVPAQGQLDTSFALAADLDEDTRYCWRVRSDDGAATSAYATACFLASAVNHAPSVPTLQNPSDTSIVSTIDPTYSWAQATDPEGESITYDVEVTDAGGTVVGRADAVVATVTALADSLEDGATYRWRVRAVDAEGAASAYSADNEFVVGLATPGDGGGCCSTGTGEGAASAVLLGLGVLGLVGRRRRRPAT